MPPKQSQEMREAIRLVQSGVTQKDAAIRCGVRRESLNQVLKKLQLQQKDLKQANQTS